MKSIANNRIWKFLFRIMSVGMILSICFEISGMLAVRAQADSRAVFAGASGPQSLSRIKGAGRALQSLTPNSTWYVATTGADGNTCLSSTSPCKTIMAAIGKAVSGDTVNVAGGTYQENLVAKDGVNLNGAGMFSTIVDAGGIKQPLYIPPFVTTTIQQMAFTNSGIGYVSTADGGNGFANAGVVIDNATATLTHCRVYNNNFFSGILSYYGTNTFAYDLVDHNVGYGIFLSVGSNDIVQNNTITGNTTGGVAIFSTPEIIATIFNNIIASNTGYGIDMPYGTGAAYSIDYNDIWDNPSGSVIGSISLGTGNLALDPKFRSAGSDDYSLLAASPVIDMGNPAAQYNDLDGSRNDMGAFPFLPFSVFLPLVIH